MMQKMANTTVLTICSILVKVPTPTVDSSVGALVEEAWSPLLEPDCFASAILNRGFGSMEGVSL